MEFIKFDGHVHVLAMCFLHQHYDRVGIPVSPFKIRQAVRRILDDRISFVMTDHDTLASYEALQKNDFKGKKIVEDDMIQDLGCALRIGEKGYIICGEEITTKSGHILAWGIEEFIPPGLSLEETIDRINNAGALAVVPHVHTPLGIGEKNFRRIADNVHGIELSIGIPIQALHRKIYDLAKEYGIKVFAGTDSHLPRAICGQGYSKVPEYVFRKDSGKKIINELRFLSSSPKIEVMPDIARFVLERGMKIADIGRYMLKEMPSALYN